METWAHGQAVYDVLGKTRVDADRIKNIAATSWMSIAQCFAGPPEDPPALGSRFRQVG